eukprot:NODE_32_length_32166_cov_0.707737.p13 type:complete len:187 gc:universal NODE_32_length_32166_cov_0.707737:1210-650(-)
MALKDAYYLHVVFEKEKLLQNAKAIVKKTMGGLPEQIKKEKTRNNSSIPRKPPIFDKSNLIVALQNEKLRFLACGYIGYSLKSNKDLSIKELTKMKSAIEHKSMKPNFKESLKALLEKHDARNGKKSDTKPKALISSKHSDLVKSLEDALRNSEQIKNGHKTAILDRQCEIITKAIETIGLIIKSN